MNAYVLVGFYCWFGGSTFASCNAYILKEPEIRKTKWWIRFSVSLVLGAVWPVVMLAALANWAYETKK